MNHHPLVLTNPFCKTEKEINNLKTNIKSRFQAVISKPRIAVKSFAKVSCLGKSEEHQIIKPTEEVMQNLEGVIDAVVRGDGVEADVTGVQKREIVSIANDVVSKSDEEESEEQEEEKAEEEEHIADINKIQEKPRIYRNTGKTTINKDNTKQCYYCTICKYQVELSKFETKHHLLYHAKMQMREHFKQIVPKPLEKVVNETVYCELCNKTFENGVVFCLHSIEHNNNEKYSCYVCKYTTHSKQKIERHAKSHKGKTFNCEVCKKKFTSHAQSVEHSTTHTGEKPFLCDICGRSFSKSSIFSQHRRDQHWKVLALKTPEKYDCKFCDKKYNSRTGVDRHVKRHHIQGFHDSQLCDICGKILTSKEIFKFHRRTHTGYKPYACNVCDKNFSKKEQLREHMRVHSGEKPFKCKHCGKCFTQGSSLKIHERIHTGERPYVCRFCKKGFISKSVMDLHMKKCEGASSEDSD